MMNKYSLSYINGPRYTAALDREFPSLDAVAEFVGINYPDYTSYQIIAVRRVAKLDTKLAGSQRNGERITKS